MDPRPQDARIQHLLNIFVVLNIIQVVAILGMARLDKQRTKTEIPDPIKRRSLIDTRSSTVPEVSQTSLLSGEQISLSLDQHPSYCSTAASSSSTYEENSHGGLDSGEVFMYFCGGLVVFAWTLFLGTAWMRLRSKGDRGH
jgi:hypothetical protein